MPPKEKEIISAGLRLLSEDQIKYLSQQPLSLEALLKNKLLTSESIAKALAADHGLEYVSLSSMSPIPKEALDLLPAKVALSYRALPLSIQGNHAVIAIADPSHSSYVGLFKSVSRKKHSICLRGFNSPPSCALSILWKYRK